MDSSSQTNEYQLLGSTNHNPFNLKPDWNNAPSWANWLAQDFNRAWWWYELKPSQGLGSDMWQKQNDRLRYAGVSTLEGSWRDTLTERVPEVTDEHI